MDDLLKEYHSNLLHMRQREDALRELNDRTGQGVIFFCLANVALMILTGGWQVLSLKNFLRAKKII